MMRMQQAINASIMLGSLCRVMERGMYVIPERNGRDTFKCAIGNGGCGPDHSVIEDGSCSCWAANNCGVTDLVKGGVMGV